MTETNYFRIICKTRLSYLLGALEKAHIKSKKFFIKGIGPKRQPYFYSVVLEFFLCNFSFSLKAKQSVHSLLVFSGKFRDFNWPIANITQFKFTGTSNFIQRFVKVSRFSRLCVIRTTDNEENSFGPWTCKLTV